jgi:hypothetical protein
MRRSTCSAPSSPAPICGRERLLRIADVLDALTKAARSGRDIGSAVTSVASLEVIDADAALIRRMTRPGRPDALGELGPEYSSGQNIKCSSRWAAASWRASRS